MLKNYLLIAFRNLLRHKLFSFITIFGLAMSMTVCLVVLANIKDALEYDTFHPYPERTYRIITQVTGKEDQVQRSAVAPLPLAGELLQTSFVEKATRVYPTISSEASDGQKKLNVTGAFADASFFDVFGFKLGDGDPARALTEPHTAVLTKETAFKFFGKQEALGKILSIEGIGDFIVTGVLEETGQKSHLSFEILASIVTLPILEKSGQLEATSNNWTNYSAAFTYVRLKPGATRKMLDQWLPLLTEKVVKPYPFKNGEKNILFEAQALGSITPGEVLFHENTSKPTADSLFITLGIAFIVLLSACFNYTNLSIARSLTRAKEVGIRKVAGAFRHQIFVQFLTESLVIALLALALSYIMLPLLSVISKFEVIIREVNGDITLLAWFVAFSLVVGLLAGALPAWMLSAYKPVQVLKNLSGIKLIKRLALRKGLVVFQFTLSLIFIIILLVYYQQSHYMVTADYGYSRKNIIKIPLQGMDYKIAASELGRISKVQRISAISGDFGYHSALCEIRKQKGEPPIKVNYYSVDHNFIPNTEVQLLAGSNFPSKLSDSKEQFVILNEKAVNVLNLGSPGKAIGSIVWLNDSTAVQVAGVLKDFNFQNFKRTITPLALRYKPNEFEELQVKVYTSEPQRAIPTLEKIWERIDPVHPFEYSLFDQEFKEQQMHAEDMKQIGLFALMALTIACLGLLGMVTYTTETRTKEVGIRKVMGASGWSIVLLLSTAYIKLILIAACIALPVGYFAGSQLLNEFAYRITFGVGTLLLSLLAMLALGLLTITSQTFKAASANPVKSLRNE